ncbi:MAG: hypothetical protein RI894_49, partial [Bacteroidota bacterium]
MNNHIGKMRWLLFACISFMALLPYANAATQRFASSPLFNTATPPTLPTTLSFSLASPNVIPSGTTAAAYKNYAVLNFDPYKLGSTAINTNISVQVNYTATTPTQTVYTGSMTVTYNPAAGSVYQAMAEQQVSATTANNATNVSTLPVLSFTINSVLVKSNNIALLTTDPLYAAILNKTTFYAEIEADFYAPLNIATLPAKPVISPILTNGQMSATWLPIVGAEQYELEWVYVDDYLSKNYATNTITYTAFSALLPIVFSNNASRVFLSGGVTNYTIPCIYEHGYVFYRVRPVGVNTLTDKTLLYGQWSSSDGALSSTFITGSTLHYYPVTAAHEAKKNWQTIVSYAEEGKRKDVVTYMDGTMRGRQSVTTFKQEARPGLWANDRMALVGETFYD